MKTLKFNHAEAQAILAGQKTVTWRLYDDKDLSVNDDIKIIDQANHDDPASWKIIGHAKVTELVEKLLGDINARDMTAQDITDKNQVLAKYQGYYGHRVNWGTVLKIVHFEFIPSAGDVPSGGMLLEEAKVFTDGGSRNNPGDSACAYVICKMDDTVVEKGGYYMGIATNNQAEYYGFKKGLERAQDLGIDKVNLFSDSQLVVNQMKGVYKVKNQELAPLHQDVKALADSFEAISFNYVPREFNKIADAEVNRILDEAERNKHKK